MPSNLNQVWVNFVNNQRIDSYINQVQTFTDLIINTFDQLTSCIKLTKSRTKHPIKYTVVSTIKILYFNLLNNCFTQIPQYLLLIPLNKIC